MELTRKSTEFRSVVLKLLAATIITNGYIPLVGKHTNLIAILKCGKTSFRNNQAGFTPGVSYRDEILSVTSYIKKRENYVLLRNAKNKITVAWEIIK